MPLPILIALQRRDLVIALAHDGSGLAHDAAALEWRNRAPDLEAGGSRRQRLVEVGLAGMGDGADQLFGGGVEHLEHLARLRRAPLAGNKQLRVGIGQRTLPDLLILRWNRWWDGHSFRLPAGPRLAAKGWFAPRARQLWRVK
jgi:hypothetical protein